jgi:hypothetical protein
MGGLRSRSCEGQDGKRAHALGAVDKHPLDVRRGGWTGMKSGIMAIAELRPAISVMEIDEDVGGVEAIRQRSGIIMFPAGRRAVNPMRLCGLMCG